MNTNNVLVEYNSTSIENLRQEFLNSPIFPNIVCLIIHGSSLYKEIEPKANSNSDIDLEIILKEVCANDYVNIKRIISESNLRIECQLRYLDEISNPNSLIMKSGYKLFMYYHYANGITLIGNNIYADLIKNLSEEDVLRSVLISAQIAFKDVRKQFLSEKVSLYEIKKNIMRFFMEILVYETTLSYKDFGKPYFYKNSQTGLGMNIIEKYKKDLTQSDIKTLEDFDRNFLKNDFNEDIFNVVIKILNLFELHTLKLRHN